MSSQTTGDDPGKVVPDPVPDESHDHEDDTSDDASDDTSDDTSTVATDPPRTRRVDKTLLGVSFVVAVGIMLVIRGLFVGVTGEDRTTLPEGIESIEPVPDSVRVLAQTSVFVDLEEGFTGRLVIDGEEIETVSIDEIGDGQFEPGRQISLPPATIYEPGNATLTFTPTEGAPVEEFGEGLHQATVVFWRIEEGPARSRSFTWTFNTV